MALRYTVLLFLVMAVFTPLVGVSGDSSVSVVNVGGLNVTIIWFERPKPDLVIHYCGVNMVYLEPPKLERGNITWDPQEPVIAKFSRYVGPGVNISNPDEVAADNYRRELVAKAFNEAFEKAGGRELGLKAVVLRWFFEWEPRVLGLIMYFGEKSQEEKEEIVRRLLQNPHVLALLKAYSVTYVLIDKANSMADVEESARLSYAVYRLLIKAKNGEIPVPESLKDIINAPIRGGGAGPYGAVVVEFSVPAPSRDVLEELIKWIRDNVGGCDIPLIFVFNVPRVERELVPLIVEERVPPSQPPQSSPIEGEHVLPPQISSAEGRGLDVVSLAPLVVAVAALMLVLLVAVHLAYRWGRG